MTKFSLLQQNTFHRIYLEAEPASLRGHHVVLLELVQLQLDAVMVVAAEVVGSTTGWVGALSFSLDLPGKSESDRWI